LPGNVADMVSAGLSRESIKREIDEVRCSNRHQIEHYDERK
jgi:hypothetical protein